MADKTMDHEVEFDLLRDSFEQWYANEYSDKASHPILKHISEKAFGAAWMMALERYTSITFNAVRKAIADHEKHRARRGTDQAYPQLAGWESYQSARPVF